MQTLIRLLALCSLGLWAAPARGAAEAPKADTLPPRVEIRGEWFYVDGEPFLIKGIGYSPYRPGQLPWKDTVDLTLMAKDFQRIRDVGFNTLRTWSPLSPEALTLAEQHGLMVLQGIWVERGSNYGSEAFREALLQIVRQEVERAKGHRNILAFLVGNELNTASVYQAGIPQIESLFRRVTKAVKDADPTRFVSYANWPALSFLDTSGWDAVCFNIYPYEPASVSHAFGYRSYVEHLRRAAGRGKPMLVTEVGLSVSPTAGTKPGYGGLKPEQQKAQLMELWDAVFQAGAQGGVIFEWNDEWWKHGELAQDAEVHDENDPEEWFGLTEFSGKDRLEGAPRPAYEALKAYNRAILLSPISLESYQDRLPVTVFAPEPVTQIRVRLNKRGKWQSATKLSRHWWKLFLPLADHASGATTLTMEALNAKGRVLTRLERPVTVGPRPRPVSLTITTDRGIYEASGVLEPLKYTITVTNGAGQPLPNHPVYWTVAEPQTMTDLTQVKSTDANGRIESTYFVHEAGIVTLSAATDTHQPGRRVGAEAVVVVRQLTAVEHQPSMWEANLPPEVSQALRHETPAFQLFDSGTERIVDYARYGAFHHVGEAAYRYEVANWEGLASAVGEGVYPNESGLLRDPAYQAAKKSGRLEGSHWDFVFSQDPQTSFFKWADTQEEQGVKQFYTALNLERAGLWLQAVKAYYAVLVHFPSSVGWTAFDPPTPWYVGKVAREKIEAILRLHPELGMRLEGAQVIVRNGFDNDVDNDTILASPGRLVPVPPSQVNPPTVEVSTLPRKRTLGKGRVRLAQYENGHWQLLVNDHPWVIRGLTYKPTAVGESPDVGPLPDWTSTDRNHNEQLDALEVFVDANRNNARDAEEPIVSDFELIRKMGVNTLRFYHTDHAPSKAKPLLRQLYDQHGLMVIMGDFVGMYTIGSGATWETGTDYLDKKQRRRMLENVKKMVREYKDEPYLLMWVLGNENNYGGVHGIVGGVGNAGQYPEAYYSFINELAQWIHAADPDHPVAVGNGDVLFLDRVAKHAPAIDVFGANAYRGWQGFGRAMFESVRELLDRPVLITEFGCPAYQTGQPREAAERDQALYHLGNWVDLADNMAGRGVGNVIGGVAFEWTDEWWKAGQPPRFSPTVQETQPNWAGPFPGGWNFEEWYGIVGQGDGGQSPFLRQPRSSYRLYERLWSGSTPLLSGVARKTVAEE